MKTAKGYIHNFDGSQAYVRFECKECSGDCESIGAHTVQFAQTINYGEEVVQCDDCLVIHKMPKTYKMEG